MLQNIDELSSNLFSQNLVSSIIYQVKNFYPGWKIIISEDEVKS